MSKEEKNKNMFNDIVFYLPTSKKACIFAVLS